MTTQAWSDRAIDELTLSPGCPRCGKKAIAAAWCRACGADFRGTVGRELWEASVTAASALRARQAVLDRVPLMAPTVVSAPGPARPVDTLRPTRATPTATRASSSATVQSVLAVAGAGLVAVAALVFTFFTPELGDHGARTPVIGGIALVFLVGAWLLGRRDLRMSAEAVGALGMAFLGLVVASAADGHAPRAVWATYASGALIVGSAMAYVGWLARLRVWFWTSLIALAAVPALYAPAVGEHTAVAVGALASGFAAFALIGLLPRLAPRFDDRMSAEGTSLTVLQFCAVALAVVASVTTPAPGPTPYWVGNALVLTVVAILAALSSRHLAGNAWALLAGAAGVAAFAIAPFAFGPALRERWLMTLVPAAAVTGLIAWAAVGAREQRVRQVAFLSGALIVVGLSAVRSVAAGLAIGAGVLLGRPATDADLWEADAVAAVALGLAAVAIGAHATAMLPVARAVGIRWVAAVGTWFAAAATLVALSSPAIASGARVAAAVVLVLATTLALTRLRATRAWPFAHRLPLIAGAHAATLLAGILTIRGGGLLLPAGAIATIAALLGLARTVPREGRFVHVGGAYAYGLLVLGLVLERVGIASLPLLCLVAVAGGAGAIAATFLPVSPRAWWAILAVTSVPFAAGVVQVVFERSGWTALSTTVLFALSLTLTVTRRPGLGRSLRALAASTLLPSLAVVAVCLGAQFLVQSGSPVVLPVIAALTAAVLPARRRILAALVPRIGRPAAEWAALAVETSAIVTAAVTIALALLRDAAGPGTALLVLVILAAGGAALAHWGGRSYGWWLAGAALTGALWCGWALTGVQLAEAFFLPPALGMALVGAILTSKGRRGHLLFGAGLIVATAPVLFLLAGFGSPSDTTRAYGLVTASAVLAALGIVWRRAGGSAAPLAAPALVASVLAGAGGAVQGVRWGLGLDAAPPGALPLVLLCLGIGVAGALPAAISGGVLRLARPWRRAAFVPAAVYVPVAAWSAIRPDWPSIWTMWALMIALLFTMVAVAFRARTRDTAAPPVPLLFALAFATAVVAWSPRELRVEWFSLPLGMLLVAAGLSGLGSSAARRPALLDWPRGARGSWALLGPGILVVFSASVSATYTDPQTWRAILVIVLALAAILVGAARRLAAPFLIGMVVLPVENALAFIVQIGRGIQSMPWWITLSVVGAVLLIIAVTYERRAGSGFIARLRDLR